MKLDSLNVDLSGTEVTVRKTEIKAQQSVLKKLGGIYDEHAKLVFLLDVSGSMSACVAKTYTDQYAWTPELLADIRAKVARAVAKNNALLADPMLLLSGEMMSAAEGELLKLRDDNPGPNGEMTFTPADDEELKERVVRHNLISALGVPVNWARHTEKAPTRMELVNKLTRSECEARFKKFPKSRIAVIAFGGNQNVLFNDGQPEELSPVLESLDIGCRCTVDSGQTDILGAIKRGMTVCRENPSQVGLHHFIVVGDGMDNVCDSTIMSWVPTLKASGVVLDYIHIGDHYANSGLREACAALGGEMVVCNTEREFETRFVERVNRPLLPPAA